MLSRLTIGERRDQLVECALGLAQRSGMNSVTVRAVAEEAGVSLGVVHYCFANKDELMAAMVERAVATHLQAFLTIQQTPDDPAEIRTGSAALHSMLSETLASALMLARDHPQRWLVLIESTVVSLRAPDSSGSASAALRQNALAEQYGLQFLTELGARSAMTFNGGERDVVRGALQLIYGMIQWWLVDRDDEAATRSLDLLAGWITDRATPVVAVLN
ncbi:TetR/AcrR family transcriptional regulator [Williamsia sp.]|uniref:TetR/AcrR family transcriptional regulator n=1 Tax=Williamsia sp. TaxID=1872085 RepID=UPI0025F7E085|nr:TetR/AcrR family transcriptional regulator [Williamsia sp.]